MGLVNFKWKLNSPLRTWNLGLYLPFIFVKKLDCKFFFRSFCIFSSRILSLFSTIRRIGVFFLNWLLKLVTDRCNLRAFEIKKMKKLNLNLSGFGNISSNFPLERNFNSEDFWQLLKREITSHRGEPKSWITARIISMMLLALPLFVF